MWNGDDVERRVRHEGASRPLRGGGGHLYIFTLVLDYAYY